MNRPSDPVDSASALFAHAFGGEADGVWSAPGRVNLIGEHTDYNDGFAMPFAIDRRTAAAVRRTGAGRYRVVSDIGGAVVEVRSGELVPDRLSPAALGADDAWAGYPLGVATLLLGESAAEDGFDLAIASTVPLGAGLSSSAAIECAVAVALDELTAQERPREDLARIARSAENDVVGAPTGVMDQYASLFGRPDSAVLLDCRDLTASTVPFALHAHGLVVLVMDSNERHAHATGGYRDRRASCERAVATLGIGSLRDLDVAALPDAESRLDDVTFRRVRHVVTENARVLETARVLATEGPTAIGPLLLASHASMRDDYEISTPALDRLVESAVAAGALGARMTGGGFGGAAIALVPAGRLDAVRDAVLAGQTAAAHPTPTLFTVVPSDGAHRDR